MKHLSVITLTAAVVCTSVVPAQAQSTNVEKATRLYNSAMEAHSEGRYREASDMLAKAFAYDNNLVYQYNRVMFLQLNGDYAEALSILDIYEDPMLEDPNGRFRNISMLRSKLTAQAEEKAEMEAMLAAKKLAEANEKTDPSDPSTRAPDGEPGAAGAETPAPSTSASDTAAADEGSSPVLGYTLVGVGGASLVAGGLLFSGIFAPEMDPYGTASWEAMKAQTIENQKTASIVLLAGGAVLVGAGVALVLLHDDGTESEAAATLHLAPTITTDAFGAQVFGRF